MENLHPESDLFVLKSHQNEFLIETKDILSYKLDINSEDPIALFIKSIIKLKTDVNYINVVNKYTKNGKFDLEKYRHEIKPGNMNIQAYLIIIALKIFIDKYSEEYYDNLKKYVDIKIMEKHEELYFSSFDKIIGDAVSEADQILDALCVKFYNELMYVMHAYFNAMYQVLIINAEKNGYLFKFRDMNIAEAKDIQDGKLSINRKE